MHLIEIFARNVQPIKFAHIGDMSSTVVIAGPNGVGKTRLLKALLKHIQNPAVNPDFAIRLRATDEQERVDWGKAELDTRSSSDVGLLKKSLQKNRRRGNFTSSFLNFESDRTIRQVQQYNWDWNFVDPLEEEVTWNFGLSNMTARFQDLLHSIFRTIRSRREAIALHYEELAAARKKALSDSSLSAEQRAKLESEPIAIDQNKFPDALAPFKLAFSQLLSPKWLIDPEIRKQQLFYQPEEGAPLPITSLSSGEREVVNIVFDFLLRAPSDCIIIFDEPELHLHPELSYRLIQTLGRTGNRNQFIFCTHSSEIITASLQNTVVFIAPPKDDRFNQAILVREDDETHQALKLLGQSIGIISLGKKLVLIEGESSSLDKQTYGAILKEKYPRLVLVPSGGKTLLQSFAVFNDKVLARTIWGVEFFMLCDRDALPLQDADELEQQSGQRIKILKRYHLENYFLDEATIAKVFEPLTQESDPLRSPAEIRRLLRTIAKEHASYAAALATAAFFREQIGNVDIMPKGCNGKSSEELAALILERARQERSRVSQILDDQTVAKYAKDTLQKIDDSLTADDDEWKSLVPGKVILKIFCSRTPLLYENFRTAYIRAADEIPLNPFAEILKVFDEFDRLPPVGNVEAKPEPQHATS